MKLRIQLLIFMFFLSDYAIAQDGPFVPCEDCLGLTQAPLPETGIWYNPEQNPGSGFVFEVQDRHLGGYFYGYADGGNPEWHIVAGELERSEQSGVLWELQTTLTRVEGGSCPDCQFEPPDHITEGAPVRLEFMQRNYMRISIGEKFDQFLVPLTFGSEGHAYFSEQTPYVFPVLGGTFILARNLNPEGDGRTVWESRVVDIFTADHDEVANTVTYDIWSGSAISDQRSGTIRCELNADSGNPGCILRAFQEADYIIPVGNLGDSRFFGEANDGSTIHGIRLDYD